MDETLNLTEKLKRYKDISVLATGIISRLVGSQYLGANVNKELHARDIKKVLGALKGSVMKIAQILSTVPGLIPDEYADVLSQLQNQAPAMGWLFVKRRMKNELGPNWSEKFKNFDKSHSFAASLGQVHRAILPNGDIVACKLQYPNMRENVEIDLNQLKIVLNVYEKISKVIKISGIMHELETRLREELDYTNEAKNIDIFTKVWAGSSKVKLPKVYTELSTDKLLVMEWLQGSHIKDYVNESQNVRDTIALNLFNAWYMPLYNHGVLHGDPHLGNYTVCDDYSINLLDFGCIRTFGDEFVEGIIELFYGLLHNKWDRIVCGYEMWGFKDLNKETIETLNIWARFIFDPLLDDKVRLINAHHTKSKLGSGINC